jgi:Fructose-2,6-bisphosphatase
MITLIRHGLDDERYIGGWSDVDLIDVGVGQIEEVGKFLKDSNYRIDKIYASDVLRAQTTAKILASHISKEIIYDHTFRELNKGDLNGMPVEIAKQLYPSYKEVDDIYPNGESMLEFYKRIKEKLDYILSLDNSAIITHRGVINMLYFILLNKEVDMDKKQFGVEHASVHLLDPIERTIHRVR